MCYVTYEVYLHTIIQHTINANNIEGYLKVYRDILLIIMIRIDILLKFLI